MRTIGYVCMWEVDGCEERYDFPLVNHPANEIKIEENKNMISLHYSKE